MHQPRRKLAPVGRAQALVRIPEQIGFGHRPPPFLFNVNGIIWYDIRAASANTG
jgi:hypothetical protein